MREVTVPGDLAETDDDPDLRQKSDLVGEVRSAGANLFRRGFVTGRRAADYGAYPHAAKPETVIDVRGVWLIGEAGIVEDGIEEVPGAIAREDAAGSIAAVGSGSEAQSQDAGSGIAEARHRPGPVGLIDVGAAFAFPNAFAVFAKSRAALTCGDSFMKHCQA